MGQSERTRQGSDRPRMQGIMSGKWKTVVRLAFRGERFQGHALDVNALRTMCSSALAAGPRRTWVTCGGNWKRRQKSLW